MYRAVSAIDGYGLNMAANPQSVTATKKGLCLLTVRVQSIGTYRVILPELHAQRYNINYQVKLEHAQEEVSKILKHFREEVPPQSHIWCQVSQ